MKQHYFYFLAFLLLTGITNTRIFAQTVWTGTKTTFTKVSNADHTLESNQDRITSNVWITRASTKGIFNIKTESSYDDTNDTSPADTEWAYGTTADIGTLTFKSWLDTHNSNPPSAVGQDMVLHLITDDIYIDIKFLSWSQGPAGGGGFSYERSTDQSLSISSSKLDENITIYPNPSKDYIKISGISTTKNYTVLNVLGAEISKGIVSKSTSINIKNYRNGVYFLQLEQGKTLKFLKH